MNISRRLMTNLVDFAVVLPLTLFLIVGFSLLDQWSEEVM